MFRAHILWSWLLCAVRASFFFFLYSFSFFPCLPISFIGLSVYKTGTKERVVVIKFFFFFSYFFFFFHFKTWYTSGSVCYYCGFSQLYICITFCCTWFLCFLTLLTERARKFTLSCSLSCFICLYNEPDVNSIYWIAVVVIHNRRVKWEMYLTYVDEHKCSFCVCIYLYVCIIML